jgi:hypothetical protein
MKAITGYAVWFWAMVYGSKNIENRTLKNKGVPAIVLHRGPLLLHASKKTPPEEYRRAREIIEKLSPGIVVPEPEELPHGCIIGRARAVGYLTSLNELFWGVENRPMPIAGSGIDLRWKFQGSYALVLEDRVPVTPVPCKGALGLWSVPPSVLAALGLDEQGQAIRRDDPRQMSLPYEKE